MDHLPRGHGEAALIREYQITQASALAERLVRSYLPLVRAVARRYARPGTGADDLVQTGAIGLLKALAWFDPARGVAFQTYARHLIAGEIRHELRDRDGLVRLPRSLEALAHKVARATYELTQPLGRLPTVAELATAARLSEDEVADVLHGRDVVAVGSLDGDPDDGWSTPTWDRALDHHRAAVPADEGIALRDAVTQLPSLQRKVIYSLFYLDLTQTETGRRLGVSQKHVSRLLHKGLRRLRTVVQGEEGMSPEHESQGR